MNELTLEVLAPYLPYGLKQYQRGYGLDLITEVTPANVLNLIDGSTGYKPILRPLSDWKDHIILSNTEVRWMCNRLTENIPYWKFNILVKEHVDVFGLIPKGIAIDINTLK